MPRLTKDEIVRAAVELLDAEGLDGLNMRSLGARLGSAATAVYWHVTSKDNLVQLAGDVVWDEIELPDLDDLDWRTAATAMATGLHAMMVRHPWLVQAMASHMIYGPGKARFDDHTLAVYEMAGFSDDEADQAAASVFMFVLGNAVGPAASVSLARRFGGDIEDTLREAMAKATDIAMKFPRLRARLDKVAAAEYNAAPDQTFDIGLTALLDGFENGLSRRR
ncbi:TetR/AcrR family transcriptional regulator [Kibdelosporangium philippinense]|uniref:TetR/AcrR family transcriptional regulator n=1 Tax=Kibdelosporangium philippinense TaxID=211113 RepID=A0ABS8ZD17_9PSEU|nr:TetR/AcrR family transcriptional regulator [Kibdelosporangium philippinense]MCE7004571.1 TetR/AcrR family transcriptional regulator [Kibdelosporangium philippinense]